MKINVAVIELKRNIYVLVSLKNLKFLQNILQRYTIIPEFFENFKSIRNRKPI
jgi:hypothetical protein